MDCRRLLWPLVYLFPLVRCLSATRDDCFLFEKYENTRKGFALTGNVISSIQVPDLFDCSFACLEESRCQSYNFRLVPGHLHRCELNNETMATKPENYQPQANTTYYDAVKAPVFQRLDNAIHRIDRYPVDKCQQNQPRYPWIVTYPVDIVIHLSNNPGQQQAQGCSSSPCQNGGKCIDTCPLVPPNFRCECEEFYFGDVCQHWTGDFDLSFQTKSVSNYANTTILNQSLTALTFCIWFQTTQSGSFGLFSGDIDLTCEDNGQCTFVINSAKRTFYSAPLNDGVWHSVCVTWQKSTGICTAYVDGKTNDKRSFDDCRGNYNVELNGKSLVLGQKMPNHEDDLFLESHSLIGNLSRLNVWDFAMNGEQVHGVAMECSRTSGTVLSWPMFKIDLQGTVVKTDRSSCIGTDFSANVSVEFPAITNVDHIRYSETLPSLQAFTLCHWIKIFFMDSITSTVSYANSEANNALLITLRKNNAVRLYLNKAEVNMNASPLLDKHWHHVCITWTNIEGNLNFYVDGSVKKTKTEFKSGAVIKGGGVVIIGQDQDSLGGSFVASQSLAGLLSHVNMWNFVLRTFALVDMAAGFGTETGNTIAWRDLVRSEAHGQVKVVSISDDLPRRPKSDFKFTFPTQSEENFVQLQNAASESDIDMFTACVWVKISVEVIVSLFCYRTPKHRNSIAIRPKPDEFSVILNGQFLHIDFDFGTSEWQHVCFKWENGAGNWELYINGEAVKSGTGFQIGKVIEGGGKVVLGQRYSQGDSPDKFKPGQSFIGQISHLNIWNISLSSGVLRSMYRGCDFIGGNWFNWAAILQGEVAGNVTMETPADCTLPDEISSNKRDKVCETETMDGCVSPVRALFDGKPNRRSKKWRCYFADALTEDAFGLVAYDKDKSSTCYKNLNWLLKTIK